MYTDREKCTKSLQKKQAPMLTRVLLRLLLLLMAVIQISHQLLAFNSDLVVTKAKLHLSVLWEY